MRRSPRLLLVATAALLIGAGCNSAVPPDPVRTDAAPPVPVGVPDLPGCNGARLATCALPFPSDAAFTVEDPSAATGRRVTVSNDVVARRGLRGMSAAVLPSQVFANSDGFSPLGPVLFEVDRTPVASSLDGAVTVVDLDTGAVVPVRAEVDREAERRNGHVVRVWPRARFEFGHRYAAALSTKAYATDGVGYAPAPGMRIALRSARYKPAVDALAKQNVARSDIISATYFTVRSSDNAKQMMRNVAAQVTTTDHPVRNLSVSPNFLGITGVDCYVTGEVRLDDFRQRNGGWDAAATPSDEWIGFTLTIPVSAATKAAPVVVFGHPITFDRSMVILEAALNAQRGAATIAIDFPNHGVRADSDGGDYDSLITPTGLARLVSGPKQSVTETVALAEAVRSSLADLDAAPFNLASPLQANGTPDLDTNRIVYEGISLGGVFGMPAVALSPTIGAGAYLVAGGALGQLITGSERWEKNFGEYDNLGFRDAIPTGATAGEQSFLVASVQHALDPVDPVVWADELRTKPSLMINSFGDRTVPNRSTQAAAESVGLPLYGQQVWEVQGIQRVQRFPRNGNVLVQVDTRDWLDLIRNEFGHFAFVTDPAQIALNRWLGARLP
ncbi:MAG: hypothetical protein ACOYNI_10315 [Acidimicrobiia bacterium]